MTLSPRRVRVPLDALVRDRDRVPRAGSPRFPVPISERLDLLVRQANAAGAGTSREELITAWICSGNAQPRQMKNWVERYRQTTVRDLVEARPSATMRDFTVRPPGRPSGS